MEFDKLFISGNSNDSQAHETTTGVQNELLKVLESPVTSVFGDYGKYVNASTSNCLFIFAGAFNNESDIDLDRLRELGVKTELIGRVGLIYNTAPLTIESMFTILDNSELLKHYLLLFPDVNRKRVLEVLKTHITNNFEMNTLGARYINTLIHQYFIKGGKIDEDHIKKISFHKTLSLD
jgi:ATP-dependent protease Clp ATPase subunit